MMQLNCPWCGPRDESEFAWAGVAHVARAPLHSSDADWYRYLLVRENPKGLHRETWRHVFGCGQCFVVVRDTVTHRVHAVYCVTDPPAAVTGS